MMIAFWIGLGMLLGGALMIGASVFMWRVAETTSADVVNGPDPLREYNARQAADYRDEWCDGYGWGMGFLKAETPVACAGRIDQNANGMEPDAIERHHQRQQIAK